MGRGIQPDVVGEQCHVYAAPQHFFSDADDHAENDRRDDHRRAGGSDAWQEHENQRGRERPPQRKMRRDAELSSLWLSRAEQSKNAACAQHGDGHRDAPDTPIQAEREQISQREPILNRQPRNRDCTSSPAALAVPQPSSICGDETGHGPVTSAPCRRPLLVGHHSSRAGLPSVASVRPEP